MPKKKDIEQQILDEVDRCWEEYHKGQDAGQIMLEDLLKQDPTVFEKNILWVGKNNEFYPYYYVNLNGQEKVLVNYPYQEIDIKAFRNGDLFYQNKSLQILN